MQTIRRINVLNQIGDYFQNVIQCAPLKTPGDSENVTKYLHKAEALIEFLEIRDCGSFGGFDKGQPYPRNLFSRWDWLYRKYDNPASKRFGCDIVSYENIKEFFA